MYLNVKNCCQGTEYGLQLTDKKTAFEYALVGRTHHSPLAFFETAYQDVENRAKWDESCAEAKLLSTCAATRIETLFWVTRYPWPVAERDYVYHRRVSKSPEGAFHGASWVGE
jgi:hypothetical protein